MNISWAGLACFKIEGSALSIIIDPPDPSIGIRAPFRKADAILSSSANPYHGGTLAVKDEAVKFIRYPGEYEMRDVFIYGIPVKIKTKKNGLQDLVIFRIVMDGITLVHLGALNEPLQNGQLEHLEKTDILFVPIGGGDYLGARSAQELISQIAPKIVIPMCYKTPGIKLGLDGIEKFYKEMGVKPGETLPKFKISKKDIGSDDTIIKILSIE